MPKARPQWLSILVYTALRVGLLIGVWALIVLATPIDGLLAAAFAVLVSGAISLLVLDRQRNQMGQVVGRFFSGINERIEASARAEDPVLEHRETGADDRAIGEEQDPGPLERRNQ